jgi:hypothetical protein
MGWGSGRLSHEWGCGVSSVASREMAAGLSALSEIEILARARVRSPLMDRSHRVRRLLPEQFGDRQWRCMAIADGTAVPRQKHTDIGFGGAVASCYLRSSMGAEENVTNASRRSN